jgi:hypothetical protein
MYPVQNMVGLLPVMTESFVCLLCPKAIFGLVPQKQCDRSFPNPYTCDYISISRNVSVVESTYNLRIKDIYRMIQSFGTVRKEVAGRIMWSRKCKYSFVSYYRHFLVNDVYRLSILGRGKGFFL